MSNGYTADGELQPTYIRRFQTPGSTRNLSHGPGKVDFDQLSGLYYRAVSITRIFLCLGTT